MEAPCSFSTGERLIDPPRIWNPHRRYSPLSGEWVLVSPQRTQRPWLGQVAATPDQRLPAYDPQCYLCPNNLRAMGVRNPDYQSTYVFDNDFPALFGPGQGDLSAGWQGNVESDGSPERFSGHAPNDLFINKAAFGICRVVCFSPRHDLGLPELPSSQVEAVVRTWMAQLHELAEFDFIRYVQIFENKGASMGASNPHPHGQIWATSFMPDLPAREQTMQAEYLARHGTCLLCDYLAQERQMGDRLVAANAHFTALVPYWAVWPFETLLLPNRHIACLRDLEPDEVAGLAELIQDLTSRYDNLFHTSFPYSMGFHLAPLRDGAHAEWHLHAHYFPPLLRSATVRKFMVGFEMLANPQRDLTPEEAAERLRALPGKQLRLD